MPASMQDKGRGSRHAAPSDDGDRYDPLRIALRNARDAFDPDRAALERRAATAPLIWYIEDTPDMALRRPIADTGTRAP